MAAANHPAREEFHTQRFGSGMEVETHLSWLQSRLSTERTLMSLVRFATTLIALGFSIVEYLEHYLVTGAAGPSARPDVTRLIGIGMIAAGVVLLIIALWHYRVLMTFLWSPDYRSLGGTGDGPSPAIGTVALAILLVLVGSVALGAILLRLA